MSKHIDFSDHPDVMVSSTYADLRTHREAVCDALLRLGFFPVGMEYDSAKSGKDLVASSMDMVGRAHAYIGIIGHRYGGVPQDLKRNPDELSITELEYREALRRGVPVFIFLMSDEHPVKRQDVESGEFYQARLKAFKADARERSICPTFSSVDELGSQVLHAMSEFRSLLASEAKPTVKRSPRKRFPRQVTPPNLLAVPNFISGHEFVGRRDELAWLDEWAVGSDSLLVVEAIGGAGKSTLAWQWLNKQAPPARTDFAGRLWYSFYEGGADMRAFAASAFSYVTGQPLSDFRGRKVAELADMLLTALRARPFLLVLDGLERVLVAYHRLDASQARDDQVASGKDDRACIKPADGDLLRQLVASTPSKILITSRLLPTALLNKSGQLLPGARHLNLRGLHPNDALTMMRAVGTKGDGRAIQRYLAENFDNHPLIVGIVAGLVKDYVREPGNFDRWSEDPQAGSALHLSKLDLIQRQTHILAAALTGLEPGVRQVLSRIAAIGSAVRFETVEALNPFMPLRPKLAKEDRVEEETEDLQRLRSRLRSAPLEEQDQISQKIAKLTKYIQQAEEVRLANRRVLIEYEESENLRNALPRLISALRDLDQRGLLQWDRQKNTYDLHPVVRGYAFDALEQPEREAICINIADHFRSRPADRFSETKTLADVQQSMNIFRALVQARRFGEALRFYRGDFANALSYSVEAYHEIVALLMPLFPNGFGEKPVGFKSSTDQSYLLNNAAVALISLGRLTEARQSLIRKLAMNLEDWEWDREKLRVCLTNLGETLRDENKLAQACRVFELALELAVAMGNTQDIARAQWYLMATYRITGQFEKARHAYEAFRSLPIPLDREVYRVGDIEEELCWLKFYEGSLTDDELNVATAATRSGSNRPALRSLLQLRGEMALERGDATLAVPAFESAIEMAQAVGLSVGAFEAHLALAKARVGARDIARDICDRINQSEKPPYAELASAYLELGDHDQARLNALAGYSEAWADGPPYTRWREVEQCRNILKSIGDPSPSLPRFDPLAIEPVPYEAEIVQVIANLKKKRS